MSVVSTDSAKRGLVASGAGQVSDTEYPTREYGYLLARVTPEANSDYREIAT